MRREGQRGGDEKGSNELCWDVGVKLIHLHRQHVSVLLGRLDVY